MLEQGTESAPTLTDLLFERAHDGLCVVAPDGTVLRANSEWMRSTGFSLGEVLGADLVELFPATRDLSLALHARARAGHHVEVPRHVQMIDGRETWWEGCIDPVPMEGGMGLLISAREVTSLGQRIAIEGARADLPTGLLQDEEQFRALLDQVGDVFFMHDFDGRFLDVNRRACERLGYPREELLQMSVTDIEQDFDLASAQREWVKLRPDEQLTVFGHARRKDGTIFPAEIRLGCIDVDGRRLFLGVSRDITDRASAETALRESELLYRSLFNLAPSSVVLIDETGKIFAFNDRAHERLGYTREEFAKLRLSDIDADESPEDVRRHVLRIFDAGTSEFDARHREKSGELRYVRARSRIVQMGGKRRLLSVWQDVTEQKRTEGALRASEARLRATLEATPDAIIVTRLRDGVYTAVNDGFERLSGWARPDIIGKTGIQLGIWVDLEQRRRLLESVAEGNAIQNAEASFRRKDGSVFTGWLSARTFEADGERFMLAITRDISDLRAADAALREADRRKDDFLGMLSHELRNPLAPIRNALYILDHAEPAGQQARRAKEVARRQLVHITRLVDDLLDVTRIARGKIELRRAEVDLAALALRTAEDHRALMQERGLELRLVLPPVPVVVNGDETRLAQVLGNLLHNASKFTPTGGQVTLTVSDQSGRAVVQVQDTGVGMEAETLRTIFEPFVQGKQTLARSEGGLGLGLALVRGLVTLHGGDITARSAGAGKGTEFVLTLPLDRRRSVRPRPEHGSELGTHQRRRVLVVDDNPDAAETLAELLKMVGHDVVVAHDGPSALALAKADPPDVVLCDIGLPGMDGYELARQLRAGGAHRLRLVAVSGYAQPEDVARAIEAGFDAHVAKPLDPEELARVVAVQGPGATAEPLTEHGQAPP
jgi:PAS domain S-box-containing protein